MKKTFLRRALSLLLSMILCVSLALPAVAAEGEAGGSPVPDFSKLSVSLGSNAEMILNDNNLTLSATISGVPEDVTPTYTYEWSSGNTAVATVSGSDSTVSIVRGGTPGRTKISVSVTAAATLADGSTVTSPAFTASRDVLLPGITLSPSSFSLKTRETQQITAKLYVPSGSDETVTWKCNNEYVATVSSGGLVTAASAGTTFITATAGAYSAESTVTVNEVLATTITASATADAPLPFSSILGQIDTQLCLQPFRPPLRRNAVLRVHL